MFDWILAQEQNGNTAILNIMGGAGGAGVMGGVILFFVKREFTKITKHVGDTAKHIPAGSVIVTEKECLAARKNLKEDSDENKTAMLRIHTRLDDMILHQARQSGEILTAIKGIKG